MTVVKVVLTMMKEFFLCVKKCLLNEWTVAVQLQCGYVSFNKKVEKYITSSLTSLS